MDKGRAVNKTDKDSTTKEFMFQPDLTQLHTNKSLLNKSNQESLILLTLDFERAGFLT